MRCNHVLLSMFWFMEKSTTNACLKLKSVGGCWWYFLLNPIWVEGCRMSRNGDGFLLDSASTNGEIHWEKRGTCPWTVVVLRCQKNADCQQTSSTKKMIDWEIWYSTTGNPSFGLKFRTFDSRGMKMSTTNERNPWNFHVKKLCLVFVLESSHWFIHWLHPFEYMCICIYIICRCLS